MKTLALAAAAAAGLLTVATSAAATEADQREVVSLRVNSAGVNFADPAEVAQFRREVERQIAAACNPGDRVNADTKPDFRCRRELVASLEPTVTYMAARATRGDTRFVGLE